MEQSETERKRLQIENERRRLQLRYNAVFGKYDSSGSMSEADEIAIFEELDGIKAKMDQLLIELNELSSMEPQAKKQAMESDQFIPSDKWEDYFVEVEDDNVAPMETQEASGFDFNFDNAPEEDIPIDFDDVLPMEPEEQSAFWDIPNVEDLPVDVDDKPKDVIVDPKYEALQAFLNEDRESTLPETRSYNRQLSIIQKKPRDKKEYLEEFFLTDKPNVASHPADPTEEELDRLVELGYFEKKQVKNSNPFYFRYVNETLYKKLDKAKQKRKQEIDVMRNKKTYGWKAKVEQIKKNAKKVGSLFVLE